MHSFSRRVAAVALAVALCLPSVAFARSEAGARAYDKAGRVGQIIHKIKKVFGIAANSDLPTPPVGEPSKP